MYENEGERGREGEEREDEGHLQGSCGVEMGRSVDGSGDGVEEERMGREARRVLGLMVVVVVVPQRG